MIAVAFVLLQEGWPWIVAATFCFGFLIGFFGGTRNPQPRWTAPARREQRIEPPPVRFVRAINLQGDLFTSHINGEAPIERIRAPMMGHLHLASGDLGGERTTKVAETVMQILRYD
jgi:hypothetical protein